MPKKSEQSSAPDNEHIFPAKHLTPLAVKWKELSAANRHKEAMVVLEEIVIGSTAMFERLAQYENFHHTVDLSLLVSAAQQKIVTWLMYWQPKKGRLFSWFSKCAKHAFLSEIVKVNQYRKRYHTTGESLEKFYGVEDHEIDKRDIAKEVREKLNELTCRWGDPQEIGAIRFLIECIIDEDHDKQAAIRSAAYAYGISIDYSKFFYSWCLVALRHQMYNKIHVPFTEQDLFRASESYSHLPDLADIIGWEKTKEVIAVFGGMRLKIPTMNTMAKTHDDYLLFKEMEASNLDPDSIAAVAKKHKKTPRTAQEIFTEMVHTLDPKRTGEYEVYGSEE